MSKPAVSFQKPKPIGTPRACMLATSVAPGERDQRDERGGEQPLIEKPARARIMGDRQSQKAGPHAPPQECSASGSVQSPWVRKLVVL